MSHKSLRKLTRSSLLVSKVVNDLEHCNRSHPWWDFNRRMGEPFAKLGHVLGHHLATARWMASNSSVYSDNNNNYNNLHLYSANLYMVALYNVVILTLLIIIIIC